LVPGIKGLEISRSRIVLDPGLSGLEVSWRKVWLVPGIQDWDRSMVTWSRCILGKGWVGTMNTRSINILE